MAKKGDTVVVHYRGMLKNGKVFDSTEGREPIQFIIGSGSMIKGFEKAVSSMKIGEIKTVTIKAKDAYGPISKNLILEIQRDKLPPGISPKVGDKLKIKNGTAEVKVIKTTDTSITVDGNHEMAGQELIFTLKLAAIKKKE
jgi:FKBP-type peptidyl-prolyl cis-trans isomerase 2